MHYKGEDIKKLIPQRYPFMMVSEFESGDDTHAITRLTIAKDSLNTWRNRARHWLAAMPTAKRHP